MSNIAIYGFGRLGRIVYEFLKKEGTPPAFVIDNYQCNAGSVLSFKDFIELNRDNLIKIVVCISDILVAERCMQDVQRAGMIYGVIFNPEQVIETESMDWNHILWSDKDCFNISMLHEIMLMKKTISDKLQEIQWGQIYSDTVQSLKWLKDKSISPGRWAVGYNFLYVLCRVLNDIKPKKILELGLGQSTKITIQYMNCYGGEHLCIEHDPEWIRFFLSTLDFKLMSSLIRQVELVTDTIDGYEFCKYKHFEENVDKGYELIIIDAPFGGTGKYSRRDILPLLPDIIAQRFVILIDDCGRMGEKILIKDIQDALEKSGIESDNSIYQGEMNKDVGVIVSKSLNWVISL